MKYKAFECIYENGKVWIGAKENEIMNKAKEYECEYGKLLTIGLIESLNGYKL